MAGFRRAQLRGSDELFQPTRTDNGEPPAHKSAADTAAAAVSSVPGLNAAPASRRPEGRLVRLTDEEVQTLAEAVQRLKFPGHSGSSKPPLEEFERLEELRQKLLSVL